MQMTDNFIINAIYCETKEVETYVNLSCKLKLKL